jgi:hypothetical protein
MLKYVSKLAMDILPSVVATIVGAYIVNHYIVTKPGADAPVAAAVSPADPKKAAAPSTDVANLPAAGVRARGISEKAIFEKSAAVKPTEKPQEKSAEKSLESSEDKPAETASIPVETRPRPAVPREKEKTAVRTIPLTAPAVQPAASAAPNPAPAAEAAVTPEDRRDANDLARAAIERLRGSNGSSRAQEATRTEATRTPESPRVVAAPQNAAVPVSAPAIRPLPPPIMVSTPPADSYGPAAGPSPGQPYSNSARSDDPRRPTPPADIPPARPLDLNSGPAEPSPPEHTNVAQDMLLAAKSMFHSVLPQ